MRITQEEGQALGRLINQLAAAAKESEAAANGDSSCFTGQETPEPLTFEELEVLEGLLGRLPRALTQNLH